MSIRQTFTDIANAIREKTGSTGLLYPSEMAQNILDIPQGGGEDNLPAFIDGTANFNDYASSIRNVSAIRPYAFLSDTTVINANFPKVEKIGECAFSSCTNLQTINFPKVEKIGSYAFLGCSSLQTANFPKCSYIGSSVFRSCSNLTEAIFPECQTVYGGAFSSCRSLTTAYFPKATVFSDSTFYNCYNLTSIEAPLLESAGKGAFYNCSKLSEVNFPLLKTMGALWGEGTFACTALKSVYLPLASHIGASVFANCKSLTTASLPNVVYIGNTVFTGCTSLETVTLGAYSYVSVNYPSTLFSGCTNLKSIYVPSGALNYYQTSSWWSYLSDKIVPYDESDEYIYPYEYVNNTEITEIPLSKQNAITVGYNALSGCTNLKSVNLPNCRSFYSGMFYVHLNKSIEYINIGVSWVENNEFKYCPKLREVYLPNLVRNNTAFLFEGCSNLEMVSLPSLKILNTNTFYRNTKLRTVYLYSLEEWKQEPFLGCDSLESVYIGSRVTYVGYDCIPTDGSAKIYVPNDMVDTYKNGLFSSYSSRIFGY